MSTKTQRHSYRARIYSFDGDDVEIEMSKKKKTKRSKTSKNKTNSSNIRSKSIPRKRVIYHSKSKINVQQIIKSTNKTLKIHRRKSTKRKVSKEDCKKEHRQKIKLISESSDLITKIDRMLELYYISMGDDEYNHKFSKYCNENKIDDELINTELIKNRYKKKMKSIQFDEHFPIEGSNEIQQKNKTIFHILTYCAKYNASMPDKVIRGFQISWNDMINMVEHEKGRNIAHLLRKIIKQNNVNQYDLSDKKLDQILNKFQNIQHLSKRQIDDLRGLIIKGRLFKSFGEYPSFKIEDIDYIEQDIFDVHRTLLFSQNRLIQSGNHMDIKCDKYVRPRFNFRPYFVINDDIMEISRFIFGATHFIHGLKHEINEFNFELIIIPELIESVFNEELTFPFNIGYIDKYLMDNDCKYYTKKCVAKSKVFHLLSNNVQQNIKILYSMFINKIKDEKKNIDLLQLNGDKNYVFIIDRRSKHQNIMYFTSYHTAFQFNKLRRNYCLGMSFYTNSDDKESVTRCYIHYGINEKMRFYPEHLVSVLPGLFKKSLYCDDMEYISNIYSLEYRHGFGVNLNDPMFNAEYKRCTKYEHISVNYHENVIAAIRDDDEMENMYIMKCEDEYNLDLCEYAMEIVKALDEDQPEIDLNSMIYCYDHLIRKHGLFVNKIKKQRILQYFDENIGFCRHINDCPIYNQHLKRRCECIPDIDDNNDDIDDRLIHNILYSLHSYLLHGDEGIHSPTFNKKIFIEDDLKKDGFEDDILCPILDFDGISILKWRYILDENMEPIYRSFRDEIINNKYSTINNILYNIIYQECCIKAINKNINIEGFSIKQLIAIKLYTDTEKYRNMLHRVLLNDDDDKKERSEFYWWITTLYEVYLLAAKPMKKKKENEYNICIDIDWIAHFKNNNNNILIFGERNKEKGKLREYGQVTMEMDIDCAVDILLNELMVRSEYILNLNVFYKSIGFIINDKLISNTDFINKIKKDSRLFIMSGLSGYRVIDRLVVEFKISKNILIVKFPYDHAVEHLIYLLQRRDRKIKDSKSFYKKIGISVSLKWVFKIAKHCKLYEISNYMDYRIIDRLIEELNFKQLKKHTLQQRNILFLKMRYKVFYGLKYCVMNIEYDIENEKLINNLMKSQFKIQYIYDKKKNDDNDEEEEEKKVKEENLENLEKEENKQEIVKFDHEFLFTEDCKFRLYVKNDLLFPNDEWILHQSNTINLSEFCYNLLSEQFEFNMDYGLITLLIDNIPQKYQDEILNTKYVLITNIGSKSETLIFDKNKNYQIYLPQYQVIDNINYDLYGRNELCLHYKKIVSFGKNYAISIDKILDREETIKFNELYINSSLSVKAWCFTENEGGVIRIYCYSSIIIGRDGSINAISCGYSSGFGSCGYGICAHNNFDENNKENEEYYGGTYATKGESYENNKKSNAPIYGDKKLLNYLYYGSSSGYNAGYNLQCNIGGGGIIELIAPNIINYGRITVKATMGGSGGSIKIKCKQFINYGHILAKGGGKSFIFKIGNGGDGRIAIYYQNYIKNKGHILPNPYIKKQKYKLCGKYINQFFTKIHHGGYNNNCV